MLEMAAMLQVIDANIADLVALYLREAGFVVHLAGDAMAGEEAVRARQPDLVVLDVTMPGLDGTPVPQDVLPAVVEPDGDTGDAQAPQAPQAQQAPRCGWCRRVSHHPCQCRRPCSK
mgnify:CR=1 FL=1